MNDISLPVARLSNRDLQTMRFEEALEVYTPNLADALPDHIPLQRFKRVLLTAVNLNPDLARADRRSLFNSCVKCAHDGLYPDGREAALVVYETSVKTVNERGMDVWAKVPVVSYLPMIAGIRKRMRNSGDVLAAISEVVYRNDKFRIVKGIDGRIEHEPPPLDEDRGDPVGAYAQIKLRTGEVLQEVMTKREIEHIRDTFSRGARGGRSPWSTSESEMWRKTVLRRCSKSAPSDSDLDRLLNRDDEPLDEPHPAALPPPPPTREQFTDARRERLERLTVADDDPDFIGDFPPSPAESAAPPERKEESQAGSPRETETPRLHRPRAEPQAQSREDAGSTPAESASYAVIDPDGEVHEPETVSEAAELLGGLFRSAPTLLALKALHEDNLAFIRSLPDESSELSDIREIHTYRQQELATSEPTTAKPGIGGASEMVDRQGPVAAESRSPERGAISRTIYAIEPVYEKSGEIAKAWWVVLLLPKLRAAKSVGECHSWMDANAETIALYKNQLKQQLSPPAYIAALKEIDDILKGLPNA